MAPGQFSLSLNKEITPNSVINTIDAWGHIVIVPGDLNVQEFSDSVLLSASEYTGIVYSLEIGDDESVLITGQGLIAYLGDSDTRGMPIAQTGGPTGVRSYKNKTLEELRKGMTKAELIYWAAYYEVKTEDEKKALQRQKRNSR